jgi:hypothetical protein
MITLRRVRPWRLFAMLFALGAAPTLRSSFWKSAARMARSAPLRQESRWFGGHWRTAPSRHTRVGISTPRVPNRVAVIHLVPGPGIRRLGLGGSGERTRIDQGGTCLNCSGGHVPP